MKYLALFSILIFWPISSSFGSVSLLKGQNLVDQKNITWNFDQAKKATVVIFLSSMCPCSQSHVEHIKNLVSEFPQFHFIGIHSNANESAEDAKKYFSNLNLNFPVIQDEHSALANEFRALRTPHTFIVDRSGTTIYEGGVTGSSDATRATVFYLKTALKNYSEGKNLENTKTRVLGCEIKR